MTTTVHPRLPATYEQVEAFCQKWQITRFELFGSVLRDDFDSKSDVDVLVTFADGARVRFGDLLDMEEELREMFGRPVDLVERKAIERSPNWIRRRRILESAEPVYTAA